METPCRKSIAATFYHGERLRSPRSAPQPLYSILVQKLVCYQWLLLAWCRAEQYADKRIGSRYRRHDLALQARYGSWDVHGIAGPMCYQFDREQALRANKQGSAPAETHDYQSIWAGITAAFPIDWLANSFAHRRPPACRSIRASQSSAAAHLLPSRRLPLARRTGAGQNSLTQIAN